MILYSPRSKRGPSNLQQLGNSLGMSGYVEEHTLDQDELRTKINKNTVQTKLHQTSVCVCQLFYLNSSKDQIILKDQRRECHCGANLLVYITQGKPCSNKYGGLTCKYNSTQSRRRRTRTIYLDKEIQTQPRGVSFNYIVVPRHAPPRGAAQPSQLLRVNLNFIDQNQNVIFYNENTPPAIARRSFSAIIT